MKTNPPLSRRELLRLVGMSSAAALVAACSPAAPAAPTAAPAKPTEAAATAGGLACRCGFTGGFTRCLSGGAGRSSVSRRIHGGMERGH